MVSDDRPPHSRVPERIRRRSHSRKRPAKYRRSAAKDQPYAGGTSTKRCGQGIAASFGPAERKLPPDRTALDVDDAELAAAQLIEIDATDTMAMASLLRTKLLMLSVLPSCITTRNEASRTSAAARYFEITSRVPEPLSRNTRGTVCNSASVTWSQRPYQPFVEAISTSSSGINGS